MSYYLLLLFISPLEQPFQLKKNCIYHFKLVVDLVFFCIAELNQPRIK